MPHREGATYVFATYNSKFMATPRDDEENGGGEEYLSSNPL